MSLWSELIEVIDEKDWPAANDFDPKSRQAYETALDTLDTYKGEPSVLIDALDEFEECGSSSYANAGISAVLMFGSYLNGDSYDEDGLKEAARFLKRALRDAPGRTEIAFLEVRLALLRGQNAKARKLLDELQIASPHDFHVLSVELWYWYNQRNLPKAESWYPRLKAAASNQGRKLTAAQQMAGCYMACNAMEKAEAAYRDVTDANPKDPWAWHNLSLIQLQLGKLDDAEESNSQALELMEFPVALEMQRLIQVRKSGFWGRLLGWFRGIS